MEIIEMTKRQYAEEVAKIVDGTVNEVEKANGVKFIGITPNTDNKVRPNVYIDGMYDQGMTVGEAAKEVSRLIKINSKDIPFDTDEVTDYENVKPNLRVKLLNAKTNAEVFKSAEEYGFDDLIIVPYIYVSNFAWGVGSIKIGNAMLNTWGVTADEVIEAGMTNTKTEGFEILSMIDTLAKMMGKSTEELAAMGMVDDGRMYVLSNEERMFGAIGAIILADELKERFSSGYIVIPSSIHEVIIIPRETMDRETLDNMVNDVNASEVAPEEVLGSKVYIF